QRLPAAVHSDVASLAAAQAARDVLDTSHSQGLGTDDSRRAAIITRLRHAVDAAGEAVADNTKPDVGDNPPSCTFVAVVVEEGLAVAGAVGHTPAHLLADDGEPRV